MFSIGQPTKINLAIFDLNKLVFGMRKELRGLLGEEIILDISELSVERCLVNADRDQTRDLVFHLVLDALDAMPHGGSINIVIENSRIDKAHMSTHLEPAEDYVMVAVRDNSTEENAKSAEHGDFRVVKGRALSLSAGYDAIKRCGGHLSVFRRWYPDFRQQQSMKAAA